MSGAGYELHHGDCLDVMPTLAAGSVDAVICDPPYGSTACAWDSVIPLDQMWRELRRVIRPAAPVLLFASQPFTSALVMSAPRWFRFEWVWSKTNGGGFLNANRQPLKRHESVLVFCERQPPYFPQFTQGEPYRTRSAGAGETTFDQTVAGWETDSDGRRYPTTIQHFPSETGLHPTQKPLDWLAYLVRTHTRPGALILDFTMGSGTTGEACIREGRRFIGIEKDAAYFATAARRIADAARELRGEFRPRHGEGEPLHELPLFGELPA